MSTHDSGLGRQAGRPPEFESDFANPQSAPGDEAWRVGGANTQKSEGSLMGQGAGRPNFGQGSIFGNGGQAFTQMPTYTPVTRAPQPQQAPQPSYPPQTAHQQPAAQPQPQPAAPKPQAAAPRPQPQPPQPSYQAPQPQPQNFGAQHYQQPQNFEPPEQNIPQQNYGNSSQGFGSQGYQDAGFPDLSNADPAFPESIFPDFNVSADANLSHESFSDQSADADFGGDASFPEGGDADFAETTFPAEFGHDAALGAEDDAPGFVMATPASTPQAPMTQHPMAAPQSHVPPSDPRRQLQAFDAVYDQPPQIALSGHQAPQPPQDYFETDRADADFLDESQALPPPKAKSKIASLKGRSAFMVASALLGAIALGGALAYAYKQSGGVMGNGETPMVTADARPVKEAPDQPGGKEFPHKNKLIYDRLTNGDEPESEQLMPRQEDVAVPAMPSSETAGLPTAVASTDLASPDTTQSVDTGEDGGPRKVKTLVVRPDGSVETPPPEAAAADGAEAAAQAAEAPQAVMPVPAAPITPQAAAAAPPPPAPAPQEVAAADPKPAPAPAANTKYVVQVGAKKSQTDALATFADIQQKYPTLLADYRPIVQKADLGSKGVWYRLRVGPIDDKAEAYKLCGQLKSQGLPDCLVMTQ